MTFTVNHTISEYDITLRKVFTYLRLHKQTTGFTPTITEISEQIGDTEEMILESLEFGQTNNLSMTFLH
ncbi:hypothetical protein ACI2JA_09465 [Alkalihalobacillus sp. NPDC078783]